MRMLWLILWGSLSLPVWAEPIEIGGFEAQLSQLARDELAIVNRLQKLRDATEKLPEDWKSSEKVDGEILHKQALLFQIQEMELSAASRWNLLLQNLASLSRPEADLSATEKAWRVQLRQLPGLHRAINKKLDRFNAQLKEGILLNLARQIQSSSR